MQLSYSVKGKINNLKYNCFQFIKENKLKLLVYCLIIFASILTGILTAGKYNNSGLLSNEFLLYDFVEGELYTFSSLLNRILSFVIVLLLITLSSINIFVIPLGYLVLMYRAYLVGFNGTIMIVFYGFNGIITALFIVLVFQILLFIVIGFYFAVLLKSAVNKFKKQPACKNLLSNFFITAGVGLLIIIIETVCCWLFQSNIILVI